MRKISRSLLAAPLLALAGCVVAVPEGGLDYDPVSGYAGPDPDRFREGYALGRQDALSASGSDHSRHAGRYDTATLPAFTGGYDRGYLNYSPPPAGRHPGEGRITAEAGPGRVTIRQGGEVLAVIETELPNVEKFHFAGHHREIVVKSRGNHGPAAVQRFDARTGVLRDKVMAFAIEDGRPAWARGMQD